ncbi:MAG: FAD-dependent oxidoreductase [Bauldia sp.]|nr:FAD-dependent oxidoreductase [Bauldia sp.]
MAISARRSPRPARAGNFDKSFDIVIAGGGGVGLATACFSAWLGNKVLLLEKAPELGGTTIKAAFWYWVPNNEPMKAMGLVDKKEDCLRYLARISRPEVYNPKHPRFGMSEWEYDACVAIYDNASKATELLNAKGALEYRHCPGVPDYWAELPEDKAPVGRVLVTKQARDSMSDGGVHAIRTLAGAARKAGVDIQTSHRVQRTIVDEDGRVVGVEADNGQGKALRFGARKAVVFATGGFTHDPELRQHHLSAPVKGGCAAVTNEGDFVHIGAAMGAHLRNMNYAWMCPVVFEKVVNKDPGLIGTFSPSGDSMIYVDRNGRRVTNEKLAYNESAQAFFKWDPAKSEYPNLVLVAVWDQRSQDHSASDEYGRFIVPKGADAKHVIKGKTLEELAANVRKRLKRYAAETGNLALSADFEKNLKATIKRFNGFARAGKDADFQRGERPVELLFNGPTAPKTGKNPTMYPISSSGPFYAALMTGGNLDTKGGPATNVDGQVLDALGRPIPGLYGVGNCVASASARSYWAGGATLGPFMAFAYLAANAADKEPGSAKARRREAVDA